MKADVKPTDEREKEALEWATEFFRERTDDLFKVIVTKEVTEERLLSAHRMSLEGYTGINLILGEEQNTLAACRTAATLIERGERLSKPLADFVAAFLRDPKKNDDSPARPQAARTSRPQLDNRRGPRSYCGDVENSGDSQSKLDQAPQRHVDCEGGFRKGRGPSPKRG